MILESLSNFKWGYFIISYFELFHGGSETHVDPISSLVELLIDSYNALVAQKSDLVLLDVCDYV